MLIRAKFIARTAQKLASAPVPVAKIVKRGMCVFNLLWVWALSKEA